MNKTMPKNIATPPDQACYTNGRVIQAGNIDGELGWIKEEYKKLGVKDSFFRSVRENDGYRATKKVSSRRDAGATPTRWTQRFFSTRPRSTRPWI
jgi:hypothetical protein